MARIVSPWFVLLRIYRFMHLAVAKINWSTYFRELSGFLPNSTSWLSVYFSETSLYTHLQTDFGTSCAWQLDTNWSSTLPIREQPPRTLHKTNVVKVTIVNWVFIFSIYLRNTTPKIMINSRTPPMNLPSPGNKKKGQNRLWPKFQAKPRNAVSLQVAR